MSLRPSAPGMTPPEFCLGPSRRRRRDTIMNVRAAEAAAATAAMYAKDDTSGPNETTPQKERKRVVSFAATASVTEVPANDDFAIQDASP